MRPGEAHGLQTTATVHQYETIERYCTPLGSQQRHGKQSVCVLGETLGSEPAAFRTRKDALRFKIGNKKKLKKKSVTVRI